MSYGQKGGAKGAMRKGGKSGGGSFGGGGSRHSDDSEDSRLTLTWFVLMFVRRLKT